MAICSSYYLRTARALTYSCSLDALKSLTTNHSHTVPQAWAFATVREQTIKKCGGKRYINATAMPKDLSLPYQPNPLGREAAAIRRSAYTILIEESGVHFSEPPPFSPGGRKPHDLIDCSVANFQSQNSRWEAMQEQITTDRTHTLNLLTRSGATSPSKSSRQARNRFDPLKVIGDGSLKANSGLDELTNISKADNSSSGRPCSTPGCGCSVPLTNISGQQGFNCCHATQTPPHGSPTLGRPAIPPPVYDPPMISFPSPSIVAQDPDSPPRRDQEPRP